MTKPKVAVIGTGGTIASQGLHPLDTQDYASSGRPILTADELVAGVPDLARVAEVIAVPFTAIPSTAIGWAEWRALVAKIVELEAQHPDLAGVVVTHGTATLEETAYLLSLTLPTDLPVVVTGAQRPFTGLSSDAAMNLVAAVRVAGDPASRGLGVLVVLNDEVHAAREVTKTSTGRLQTFRSPDVGVLGHVDADRISHWRRPTRLLPVAGRFDILGQERAPRVDVVYSVAGGDGVAVHAFLAAGAAGLVAAGLAPGFVTPAERTAMAEAIVHGCAVVLSSRAGSGRTFPTRRYGEEGFINADNLNPQKARILLMLALTRTRDRAEIAGLFRTA
ncbi:asparaginase [Falsiroseomonas selenitidurans]|uniref:Asparaginase n=1 Tax=Falsiroseomonas selenitidurans TaxID=2716335 RepID=A0ABX1E3R0_9PROT|nr:asparaginase [Falsiroseomonas selenitidurans]NKC31816.1 asparaginase [Falsiroseomonas selenitidurans]